jgi:hypothetical protein
MADINAADLPVGSVVANDTAAFIKIRMSMSPHWRGTNGTQVHNEHIDQHMQRGAVVLREGY